MYAGLVPHNQTCAMANMSADPVTLVPGLLVGKSRTDMHADSVQQYPTFVLVGFNCNIHYCWCDVTSTHDCWPRVSLNGVCAGSVPHY